MDATAKLAAYIKKHKPEIGKLVDFNKQTDRLYPLDFTAANTELNPGLVADTEKFTEWVNKKLAASESRYGIGGYMEHRTLYARSAHFDTDGEPRRLHLGVDIWAEAGTPVYAPLEGSIHSFHDNDSLGDYGPAIIVMHHLNGLDLYSLYGHLSRESLEGLFVGKPIRVNQQIATLGNRFENGQWPPHLHFQLMFDMEGMRGDYPGVARFSQKARYLKMIPDPDLLLPFNS